MVGIYGKIIPAMIDSRAIGNYLCFNTARYREIPVVKKTKLYQLTLVDRESTSLEGG